MGRFSINGPKYIPLYFLVRVTKKRGRVSAVITKYKKGWPSLSNTLRWGRLCWTSSASRTSAALSVLVSMNSSVMAVEAIVWPLWSNGSGEMYEVHRLRKSFALPMYIIVPATSLKIYTPGVWGSARIVACKSVFTVYEMLCVEVEDETQCKRPLL